MQSKVLLIVSVIIGLTLAQRGHYAGRMRAIVGARYQTEAAASSQANSNGNLNAVNPLQLQTGSAQGQNKINTIPQQQNSVQQEFQNQGFQLEGFPLGSEFEIDQAVIIEI